MECDRQMTLLISCYADGEATPEEAARARTHLEQCGQCRALVEEWNGQRRMLEWAYTVKLPEEAETEWRQEPASKERTMSIGERVSRWRRSSRWGLAGAFAAVIVGFVIYHFATLPPLLKIGTEMASGGHSRTVRMENGIQLMLGPDSKIRRVDSKSVRLKAGWVSATVRHGNGGLRVVTRRFELLDQGTRFQVGTGPKMDYVVVEEGLVLVKKGISRSQVGAGQVLMAQDKGKLTVGTLPKANTDGIFATALSKQGLPFVPNGAEYLEWGEGLRRLATRFPHLRGEQGTLAHLNNANGSVSLFGTMTDTRLRDGIRLHAAEIAQAMAGVKIANGNWEIPVGFVSLSRVTSPIQLPADTYYVSLVPSNGSLVWRFIGASGEQAQLSLTSGKHENWYGGPLATFRRNGITDVGLEIVDWPGDPPQLTLKVGAVFPVKRHRDEQEMLSRVSKAIGRTLGSHKLLYLDPARKRRFLIVWYPDSGAQFTRLFDLLKERRSGAADVGAFVTDEPLTEPAAPAGIYTLRLISPGASQTPRWAIVAQARQSDGKSSAWLRPLPTTGARGEINSDHSSIPGGLRSVSDPHIDLSLGTGPAIRGGFPLRFDVSGPSKSGKNRSIVGYIRIKKP